MTDVLTCPRCGPEFGLVLLADRVEERRILDGWLGCPNCRERYRVRNGHADLVFGQPAGQAGEASEAEATRLAALLGVTEGPGMLLLVGSGAANAGRIADMVADVEVVAAAGALNEEAERAGVCRVAVGAMLPFRSRSMKGVALTDAASIELLAEAVRVTGAHARVVAQSGRPDVAAQLEQNGLRVLARDESTTVAERGVF
ncbi:MAG TPA: hypothetical protein VF021_08715 [Longimicrobiales bacterium]